MHRNDVLRAQLAEHYGLTCIPRWGTPRNFDNPTYGGKVAKVAKALGTPFMPWQRYVADVALEVDPVTGIFVYRGVDLTVPRQSGKTSLMLPVAVHRAIAWQKQRILYGAQNGAAAREKWEDEHVPMLESAKAFKGKFKVRKSAAREAIIWRATGSFHGLLANTETAGHGKTLDLGMLDEYFAQIDSRLDQACGPAMITRPMAQKWRVSTAGTSKSVPLNAMRKRGREIIEAEQRSTVAYFEWSAGRNSDRRDPAVWRTCMPALCPKPVRGVCQCSKSWRHTVTEAAIFTELEQMSENLREFDRAYLNISDEEGEVERDPNVPSVEAWNLLHNDSLPGTDVLACAIDITPHRDHSAISAAGDTEVALRRLVVLEHGEGTTYLMNAVVHIKETLNPVAWVIDDKSQAKTLIEPMSRIGIKVFDPMAPERTPKAPKRGGLWIPTVTDVAAASVNFTNAVNDGTIVHPGHPSVPEALAGTSTRSIGDGMWTWGRKVSTADITTVVSQSLALEGLERWRHLALSTYDPLGNIF